MASKFIMSASLLAGAAFGSAAVAGGYVAPVVPAPVVVAPVETSDWAGAYVGGSIGYTFGADDVVGLEDYENDVVLDRANNLGQVDVKGVNLALQAGYRWQRENWVYGPELSIEGGSVDATDVLAENAIVEIGTEAESSVNYVASLRFKTGYVVNPETLVYGTLGVVHGDFDYKLSYEGESETQGYTDTGWSIGLGAERKLNEKLSVFAEWEFRQFGKTTVSFGEEEGSTYHVDTQATPEHHNIRVGVNYRF